VRHRLAAAVPLVLAALTAAPVAAQTADFASRVHQPVEHGLKSIDFAVAPPALAKSRHFLGYKIRYVFESPDKEAVRASAEFPDLAPAAASIARNYAWLSLVAGPQWLASAAAKSGVAANEKGGVFEVALDVKADSPWRGAVPAGSYALRFGSGLGMADVPEPPGLSLRLVPTDDELRAAGVDLAAEKKRREDTDGPNAEKGRAYDGPFGGEFGWVYAAAPRTDGTYVKRSEAEGVAPARVLGYEKTSDGGGQAIRAKLAKEDGERLREITSRSFGKKIAVLSGGALVSTPVIRDAIGDTVEISDPTPGAMAALFARFLPAAAAGGADAAGVGQALLLHRVQSEKLGTVDLEYEPAPGIPGLFLVKRITVQHPANGLGRYTLDVLERQVNAPIDPAIFAAE